MITRRAMMLFALALVACQGDTDRAVDPVWGKQPCEHCKMLVSQKASAAQLVLDGDRYYFDDVGCMIQWLDEKKRTARAWVRSGDGWLDAEQARYRGGAMTPMDHGYVASPDGDVTYTEVRTRVLARAKGGSP